METEGGGWTQMTQPVYEAQGIGPKRQYLYSKNNAWYRSPETTQVWSWSNGKEVSGTWAWSDGNAVSDFICLGSAEKPSVGIGCSAGATKLNKVLPLAPFDIIDGFTKVCQQSPNIFGGKICEPDVQIWVRP